MPTILKLIDYTIPYYGNKRIMPYGKLLVDDGEVSKVVPIEDDGIYQYFTFNRKRFYVANVGSLYSPAYFIIGTDRNTYVEKCQRIREIYMRIK